MSPQNSATGTTSRKPAETNSAVAVKLAPEAVAVAIRLIRPLLRALGSPPIANATTRTNGSSVRTAAITRVRRRSSWRRASTRSGRVRRAR